MRLQLHIPLPGRLHQLEPVPAPDADQAGQETDGGRRHGGRAQHHAAAEKPPAALPEAQQGAHRRDAAQEEQQRGQMIQSLLHRVSPPCRMSRALLLAGAELPTRDAGP